MFKAWIDICADKPNDRHQAEWGVFEDETRRTNMAIFSIMTSIILLIIVMMVMMILDLTWKALCYNYR